MADRGTKHDSGGSSGIWPAVAEVGTEVRDRIGSATSHADISVRTRWFTVEITLCAFREGISPVAYADSKSVDAFVPLPGKRTLWVALCSWWLADRLGIDTRTDNPLGDMIPQPPHECAVEGCDFVSENYGVFLTHDVREHPLGGYERPVN